MGKKVSLINPASDSLFLPISPPAGVVFLHVFRVINFSYPWHVQKQSQRMTLLPKKLRPIFFIFLSTDYQIDFHYIDDSEIDCNHQLVFLIQSK